MAKILVVDDNPGNRKLVVALLSQEGHLLIEANDGADGLEAARAENPDLVISDILMPSMDGFEFVRRLRDDPQLQDVAVIFHTAHYHETEARNLAAACRVSRVLVRSTGAAGIVNAVSEVLAGNIDVSAQQVTLKIACVFVEAVVAQEPDYLGDRYAVIYQAPFTWLIE